MKRFSQLFVILVLAACASSPKLNYYTLSAESSGNSQPAVTLDVQRFQTTEALSRSGILIAASPTRVEYYATDHWVSSVGELVQQKFQAEFGPHVAGRPTYELSGKVTAFEQVDRGGVTETRMAVDVVIRDPSKKRFEAPLLEQSFNATETAAAGNADAVAQSLSKSAEKIAAEIVAALAKF